MKRRFSIGQQVVCVKRGAWRSRKTGELLPNWYGPKFNDICIVTGYSETGYVLLKGFGIGFHEIEFEPLVSDAVLASELATVPEPYTL